MLDNDCADAHVALGTVSFLSDWDWVRAEHSFQHALAINPSHTHALLEYGALLETIGRLDEGLQLKQQALAYDPRSPLVLVHLAMSHWIQRNYKDTLAWTRRALEIDPRHLFAGELVTGVYWKLGDLDAYLAENIRRATVLGSAEQLAAIEHLNAGIRRAYATGGGPAWSGFMADQIAAAAGPEIDELHSVSTRLRYPRIHLAILCGAAGRLDEALQHLEHAFALRDPALVHLAVAPQWDSLRSAPRFHRLLQRIGLPAAA
jgi:tetratricopeptide (TPR) repeat protein